MKRATPFLLGLLLLITLWMGCLGSEKRDLESTLTAISAGSGGGGAPRTGFFVVNITLSEPPLVNGTVTATVGVYNPTTNTYPNTWIRLLLYRRTSLYTWWDQELLWEKILWTGTIPAGGHAMANGPLKVEVPGYYQVRGWACAPNPDGQSCRDTVDVYLHLNVSENQTIVTPGKGPLEPQPPPPPAIPYLVKMELDGVPAENRPVNLRVIIASLMDQKNATFRIFLPEGYELVSGDLVWQGDLQKAMDEGEVRGLGIAQDKISETALQRIPEGKKVRMRATIKNTLRGDARIFVFPSQERPPVIDCDLQGLYRPHPEGGGWQAISRGGCLNVRTINETDGIFSEQRLPPEPRPPKPPPPPETPPPGMMFQTPRG